MKNATKMFTFDSYPFHLFVIHIQRAGWSKAAKSSYKTSLHSSSQNSSAGKF